MVVVHSSNVAKPGELRIFYARDGISSRTGVEILDILARTSSLRILSCHEILRTFLYQRISNTSSLFWSAFLMVQTSASLRRTCYTSAFTNLSFVVLSETSSSFHTLWSFPNTVDASISRWLISVVESFDGVSVTPKYLNWSTCSRLMSTFSGSTLARDIKILLLLSLRC